MRRASWALAAGAVILVLVAGVVGPTTAQQPRRGGIAGYTGIFLTPTAGGRSPTAPLRAHSRENSFNN